MQILIDWLHIKAAGGQTDVPIRTRQDHCISPDVIEMGGVAIDVKQRTRRMTNRQITDSCFSPIYKISVKDAHDYSLPQKKAMGYVYDDRTAQLFVRFAQIVKESFFMGVTAFRQINNNSTSIITLVNHENSSNTVKEVDPHTTIGIEVWIPWCVSSGDFKWGHYLTVATPHDNSGITIYKQLCAIWQKDNQVCFSTDIQFHDPGAPIPGVCAINGDRLLTINADLTITVSVIR